jgi:hypothetical protein
MIKSKLLFVLLGNNDTGKTTLQKLLISKICTGWVYDTLRCNKFFDIVHPEIKRKYKTIFFSNRSPQEKEELYEDYKDIDTYFQKCFKDSDIAFISSHIDSNSKEDILSIMKNARQRFYNVIGVFFSNSIENDKLDNEEIAQYAWDEKLIIENPLIKEEEDAEKWKENIKNQIEKIAENFVVFIANRTSIS